jgi:hypothetical protein
MDPIMLCGLERFADGLHTHTNPKRQRGAWRASLTLRVGVPARATPLGTALGRCAASPVNGAEDSAARFTQPQSAPGRQN